MLEQFIRWGLLAAGGWFITGCTVMLAPTQQPSHARQWVAPARQSVATVVAFDLDGGIAAIGSGFFIDRNGTLVTNYHVLQDSYRAEIKTAGGERYPITAVLARSQLLDLIKVRVDIPEGRVTPAKLSMTVPAIAEGVVVIGSPMGLEQTISEGIVSAIRRHPVNVPIYQLTAPISPGSSGSPVLNLAGSVFAVVTFQASKGQNLNFAVSIKALEMLSNDGPALSIAEWTLRRSGGDPQLAASLCQKGAQLSIKGKYEAALDFYRHATQVYPDDPDAWDGLGSCYAGMNQPEDAIAAFHHSIAADPENAASHFLLAMFYKTQQQYLRAIPPLQEVIRIDAGNVQARLELADVYGRLNRTDAQIQSFKAILAFKPDHVPTLHMMGKTVRGLGRLDEALDLLRKASVLDPDNAQIHYEIGVTYHSKQLPKEELKAYARALRANPWLAPAHYNLGLLFIDLDKPIQALHQYEILKNIDDTLARRLFGEIYPDTNADTANPDRE
jgi:tetratricopeptide (TPR) repeat protein